MLTHDQTGNQKKHQMERNLVLSFFLQENEHNKRQYVAFSCQRRVRRAHVQAFKFFFRETRTYPSDAPASRALPHRRSLQKSQLLLLVKQSNDFYTFTCSRWKGGSNALNTIPKISLDLTKSNIIRRRVARRGGGVASTWSQPEPPIPSKPCAGEVPHPPAPRQNDSSRHQNSSQTAFHQQGAPAAEEAPFQQNVDTAQGVEPNCHPSWKPGSTKIINRGGRLDMEAAGLDHSILQKRLGVNDVTLAMTWACLAGKRKNLRRAANFCQKNKRDWKPIQTRTRHLRVAQNFSVLAFRTSHNRPTPIISREVTHIPPAR